MLAFKNHFKLLNETLNSLILIFSYLIKSPTISYEEVVFHRAYRLDVLVSHVCQLITCNTIYFIT